MARLLLSKATLSAQRQKLAAYQRFLPALDMKRQQLQGAIKQVEVQLQQQQQQQRQLEQRIAEQMPMLAETSIDLQGLCSVKEGMTLDVRQQLLQQQQIVVAAALRKVTQRVNLFDKVLIPDTRSNIRRIGIYLDDKERESVVTSKIAKNKRQAAGGL